MDERDMMIFRLMCEEPFITGSEVSRKTGIPLPSAIRRLNSLRKRVRVDIEPPYKEMGYSIEALVFLDAETVNDLDEIVEEIRIAGNWTHVVRVVARDIKHLNNIVSELSRGARNISTVLVVDRVKKCWKK